jgi:hypothetical protein
VGADKAYDVGDFVGLMRELNTTPHVTQNVTRSGGSANDECTTRHAGFAKSQHARPRIEPAFGWSKTIAWMRRVKLRGLPEGRLALRVRECRVQSDPIAQAAAEARLIRATCLHLPATRLHNGCRTASASASLHVLVTL